MDTNVIFSFRIKGLSVYQLFENLVQVQLQNTCCTKIGLLSKILIHEYTNT